MPIPLLSIIIPAWNVERYIEAAIRSALGQTFRDLEVIVVDDGSTDRTPQILARLGLELGDPRLRVMRQGNRGISAARNTALSVTRGAFVGLLDGDDLWAPTRAERHLDAMLRDPGLGITFSDAAYIGEDGRPTGRGHVHRLQRPTLLQMIRANCLGSELPVVRRDCFAKAGFFREELRSCEDYEMWARIVHDTGCRVELVPGPLYLYRQRAGSLTRDLEAFVENGDRAMALIGAHMLRVPQRVLREGRAVHYRIASRKAVAMGRLDLAGRYLRRALAICPWLFLVDPRAAAAAFLLATRGRGAALLHAALPRLDGRERLPDPERQG